MQQQNQEIKPEVLVKLTNQLKTIELDVPTERYASSENSAETVTASQGTPQRLHVLKMLGAFPDMASP